MIGFVTSNKHKVEQAIKVFSSYGIEITHIDETYDEASDDDNLTIVKKASKMLSENHKIALFVEDTSFFFDAYPGFPGSLAKFVFEKIGYEGIFRLLDKKKRTGYFSSAIGYCSPGKEPVVIEERMDGRIIDEVRSKELDVLPYTRIFIPEGFDKTMSEMDEKKLFDVMHRTKAYKKLAEMMKND